MKMMYRNRVSVLAVAAACSLAFSGGQVWAATIGVSDLTDGVPTSTTDLGNARATGTPEMLVITGTYTVPVGGSAIPIGIRSVLFNEPAVDTGGSAIRD